MRSFSPTSGASLSIAPEKSPRTYIAWCLAAISLPVLVGRLFDMTHRYETAMLIAAGADVAGMAMALTMPRHGWRDRGWLL